ncbi:MAG: class I SAM-dependent methyltransferase [Candidatus Shapirobacteria bacterium]
MSEEQPPVGNGLNFENFSRQSEYREVNRDLVRQLVSELPPVFYHVDVATGTGLVPELIKEEASKKNKRGAIIGIDPNETSLSIAMRKVLGSRDISIEFIAGLGQDLMQLLSERIQPRGVDGVSIHDALHEIREDEDKIKIIGSMANILKPGGLLAFNSAFTTEGISEDPMSWGKLKLRVMRILGGKRDRQIQVMQIHSPETYRQMIKNTGLEVIHEAKKVVNLTTRALAAIAEYPAFFRGALEDVLGQESVSDIEKSRAFKQAISELSISALPRVWYEIIAQKPFKPIGF